MIQLAIESTDVADFACDVLVLKYAQAFYGADAIVAATLEQTRHGQIEISPGPLKKNIGPEGETYDMELFATSQLD